MLFVEGSIRKLCLHRKKREAEKVIAEIARQYLAALKRFDVVLVYDHTSLSVSEELLVGEKKYGFTLLSASPKYESSDDALFDWAEKLGENAKNCLFVTSDRELQGRLSQVGVTEIMKPGKWFKAVKSVIGEERYEALLPKKIEDPSEKEGKTE